MKLFDDLKRAVGILDQYTGAWAVCGGVAACIYRPTPRFTGDIDFALIDHRGTPAKEIAERVTSALGLKPIAGWVTDQHRSLVSGQALVVGRESADSRYVGIDFLLPVLPWVPEAVARAQHNRLDFGFAHLPTIPVEDLVIAKLFAFQGSPERITDLDDLQTILGADPAMDWSYLKLRMAALELRLPDALVKIPGLSGKLSFG